MIHIPNQYRDIVRFDNYTELCRSDDVDVHNYEVLTSYLNTRNGELRLDKDGYLYVLKPICCVFQSVIHFFIKWYHEGWNGNAGHPHRLERAVEKTIESDWTRKCWERLSSLISTIATTQRAVQVRPEHDQGPLFARRLALALAEMEEKKTAFKTEFCQSILSAMDTAIISQHVAPSYAPIVASDEYLQLRRELAQEQIPAQNRALRGFIPGAWIPVIEQIAL